MPYIIKAKRVILDSFVNGIVKKVITVGDLNYVITTLILKYLKTEGVRYQTLNAVRGVLGDVKVEFDRRVYVPYETKKRKENGDIEDFNIV